MHSLIKGQALLDQTHLPRWHHQAHLALRVPLGHSVPAGWLPLRAAEPGLPVPAAAGPGAEVSVSAPGSHPVGLSCLSLALLPVPRPAEPGERESRAGVDAEGLTGRGSTFTPAL